MPRRKQDRPKRMKWEDGDPGSKEKSDPDGGPDSGDTADCGSVALEDSNSSQSSRSCTPESSTILPQVLPVVVGATTTEGGERQKNNTVGLTSAVPNVSSDSLGGSKCCPPSMDISVVTSFAPSEPMLTQAEDDAADEEEEEDDAEDDNDPPAPDIAGGGEDAPLDFSFKKSADEGSASETDDLSNTPNGLSPPTSNQDGPLDLSVPHRRRDKSEMPRHSSKVAKLEAALSLPTSPWGYNVPRHLSKSVVTTKGTAAIGAWNGRVKQEKLEKSPCSSLKLNRLPSAYHQPLLHKNAPFDSKLAAIEGRKGDCKTDPYRPAGRQNPWQSQWMSRSSEQTKDVFTCVWCKESFRSLADMTIHMKQSPRCGMAGMQTSVPATSPTTSITGPSSAPLQSPLSSKCSSSASSSATVGGASNTIKENVSLPRKLVRGQDVWLGKGAEQTRQILKCMWCGQSFKSLADMTTHMRVTQHYTNIISQEQIISWRTPEDKMAAQSQVNAVLTCKVCDQAFGSLKELSYHMVKNSHYKEHILRSITEGGGRRRQTRERRKKSLPVRKLLELERMELNKQGGSNSAGGCDIPHHQQTKNEVVDGKISCEECTEKVDAKDFVQHIKNCAQGSRSHSVKSSPGLEGSKSTAKDSNFEGPMTSGLTVASNSSPLNASQEPALNDSKNATSSQKVLQQHQQEDSMCDSVESGSSTSVLNAIEKLIEKSFETKGRRNAVSTGILQRLGIDEEVYPPWHPSSSPSNFGAPFRGSLDLQRKSTSPLSRVHDFKMDVGDYSGSESRSRSSSTSEKHPTSFDEHLRLTFGITAKDIMNRVSTPSSASQSCSPVHFPTTESPNDDRNNIFVAKNCGRSSTPVPAPGSHNLANIASASPSPKRRKRSMTPSSDKDASEVNSVEDEQASRNVEPEDPEDNLRVVPKSEPEEPKSVEAVVDRTTPKSEGRKTPGSRGSSVEPDSSSVISVPLNPTPMAKSIPKKRKNTSKHEDHHHHHHHHSHKSSSSSHKRRTTRSPKRKNSELPSDHESAVGSPMSTGSTDFASPKHSDTNTSTAGDHPLKELQKLLDKTDAHLSRPNLPATPGSILAFSWACSEATASDSLMKCAFCDTHFISKGAYRHHLSKMHFVKDGSLAEIAASSTWKPQQPPPTSGIKSGSSASSNGTGIPVSCSSGQGAGNSSGGIDNRGSPAVKDQPSTDESPHSKFQKYTELAKQLSSKYV